ncbi:hypothetical protein [Pseudofrankia sp. BMG5.37]|uniref:hypothetical protein n=1 Tax=Pseudofrankia sp. BMG5.37 TaxID=3050035 RepID=UPI0028947397|nr:hypothetical protein [Pseudofrankia sp. BMG5.37]MDT3442012.1 hypothetical protein [Pseudofrankia sp. BMG5.37]MDT3442540.1 hypothetical protein [Pseudofrankia sp. BMG5.37]MDT3446085.1 hypothetical protein [Pseudofrankia sp. BMG5.37]
MAGPAFRRWGATRLLAVGCVDTVLLVLLVLPVLPVLPVALGAGALPLRPALSPRAPAQACRGASVGGVPPDPRRRFPAEVS